MFSFDNIFWIAAPFGSGNTLGHLRKQATCGYVKTPSNKLNTAVGI